MEGSAASAPLSGNGTRDVGQSVIPERERLGQRDRGKRESVENATWHHKRLRIAENDLFYSFVWLQYRSDQKIVFHIVHPATKPIDNL